MGTTTRSIEDSTVRGPARRWLAALGKVADQDEVRAIHHLEIAYLHLLTVILVGGWIGLVLGEIGVFSTATLATVGGGGIVGAIVGLRRAARRFPVTWSWDVVGALPALVLAIALFAPPFEFILGGVDPGVYVSTGANIARTGSIVIADPDLAALPPDLRGTAFFSDLRHDGFYIVDPAQGWVEPHGFHLYPVLLAIAYTVGGIWASLWTTPVIALLGIAGFYLLARRLFGPVVAAVAAPLLVANPAVIWFARYPAAENLVQLWLIGGLLVFVLMLDTRSRALAVLAGATLGAAHLTKIEAIALPVALTAFFTYQWLVQRWRTEYGYFAATYLLLVIHAALHATLFASVYFFSHLQILVLSHVSTAEIAGLVVFALIVSVALNRWRSLIGRVLDHPSLRTSAPVIAGIVVVLLAAYAYYVRPRMGGISQVTAASTPEEVYAWVNSGSYVLLEWYVSPLALLLAPLGYAIALSRTGSLRTAVLLTLVIVETVLHLQELRIRPLQFWAARRYVPVVFPAFALFSSYLLWRIQSALRWRLPEALGPLAIGMVVLVSCLGGWLPFRNHTEFRGAVDQIGQIATLMPTDSIVLFDESHAGHSLATPIQYLWNRPSIVLWEGADDDDETRALIAEFLDRGRKVYWVRAATELLPQALGEFERRTKPPVAVERWGFGSKLIASPVVDIPHALATVARRPDTVERLRYELRVYQIVPGGSALDSNDR